MLENLSRDELLELTKEYNDYVMEFGENHDIGNEPVSIYEYYDNEYQLKDDDYDMYFEDEEEQLDEEEIHYEKIGVSVNDTMDGLEISVIGDNDILETYRIKMNMTRYSKMDLYNITKEVARRLTMYYYQTSANLPTLEQVEDMIKDELLK